MVLLSLVLSILLVVGPYFASAQLYTQGTSIPQKTSVKITSPKANQTVPLGQLIIYGTSSDTPETNCQVYVDWNDAKPMQNVTANGLGGQSDFSNWTFAYTQKYHLIKEGTNELTSKISCNDNSGISNMTPKYYSINVTGSANPTNFNIPTTTDIPSDNSTDHSFLPQYNSVFTNDSHKQSSDNISKIEIPNSNMYIEIHSGYSYDDKASGDKKDKGKIESYTMSNMISSKTERAQDGYTDFSVNHQDVNRYIHNLIREKLDRISDQFVH